MTEAVHRRLLKLAVAGFISLPAVIGYTSDAVKATGDTGSKAADGIALKIGWGSKYRSKKTTTAGRRIEMKGRLTAGGSPVPDASVKITRRTRVPGSEWEDLADAVTDSSGAFKQRVSGIPSSTIRAVYADPASGGSETRSVRLSVRPKVGFNAFPHRLRNKQKIVLKGSLSTGVADISPRGKTVTIKFRDLSSGKVIWRAFSVREAGKNGKFRVTHRFQRVTKPTRFRFRADVPAEFTWPFAAGISRVKSVVVRPRAV